METEHDTLTVTEVAELRRVAVVTVVAWIHHATNPLPATRRGYQWMIRRADALAYTPRAKGKPKGSKQTGV
jgi:excisionase family DNA binding protein